MSDEFCIIHLPARTLATVELVVTQQEIPEQIPQMYEHLCSWIETTRVSPVGRNIVLYDQFRHDGMRMRVGIAVAEPFVNDGEIRCTELPALSMAQVRHQGSYSQLPAAYASLHSWCMDMSLNRGQLSIEEYGDSHENESQLITDVYLEIIEQVRSEL